MLHDDEHFNKILSETFEGFPFSRLPRQVSAEQAVTPEKLLEALVQVFVHPDAHAASNVVLFWAVEKSFQHANGKMLKSTVSYIEITSRSIATRWSRSNLKRATKNGSKKGIAQPDYPLQKLADLDKGFWFYRRLIQEHGPLAIYYATLSDLNAAAFAAPKTSVREWERHLIVKYSSTHGVRPLKNRRN